jgi:excisionase family DNA binding protein
LGFHPDTVRRLLREGAIEGHRINRRAGWRVRASEVDRYIEGGPKKSGPTDEPSGR